MNHIYKYQENHSKFNINKLDLFKIHKSLKKIIDDEWPIAIGKMK